MMQSSIRPFLSERRSFENCRILRYRRGTWPHWLVRRTYYEAEYQRSDGTRVVGPVVGPRPYVAPNFLTHVPLITAGVVLFVAGVFWRRREA